MTRSGIVSLWAGFFVFAAIVISSASLRSSYMNAQSHIEVADILSRQVAINSELQARISSLEESVEAHETFNANLRQIIMLIAREIAELKRLAGEHLIPDAAGISITPGDIYPAIPGDCDE